MSGTYVEEDLVADGLDLDNDQHHGCSLINVQYLNHILKWLRRRLISRAVLPLWDIDCVEPQFEWRTVVRDK